MLKYRKEEVQAKQGIAEQKVFKQNEIAYAKEGDKAWDRAGDIMKQASENPATVNPIYFQDAKGLVLRPREQIAKIYAVEEFGTPIPGIYARPTPGGKPGESQVLVAYDPRTNEAIFQDAHEFIAGSKIYESAEQFDPNAPSGAANLQMSSGQSNIDASVPPATDLFDNWIASGGTRSPSYTAGPVHDPSKRGVPMSEQQKKQEQRNRSLVDILGAD
jgi:hypothetical protein